MGRVVKHRQWIDTQQYNLEYGYNLAGQMITEKYPSGKIVSTGYDANGRLASVTDPALTYLSAMQYLGKGNSVSQMTLGNGAVENYTLNDRFQMTGQESKRGTEVLQKYNYGYGEIDGTGNLVTKKNNGQLGRIESYIGTAKQSTQKFLYDHIGRLKESAEYRGDNNNLTYKQKFDFDRFGNMYRKAASNPTAGQQNPLPYTPIEATDISKSTNRFTANTTYDDAGNVTTDNKFRTMGFAYDANGRQVKATRASVPDAWTVYDASGNRVATKINDVWQYMVYDAFGKLVAEYGVASEGLGGVKYLQQDWQGSVRTTTNSNGFVVGRTDHQAFGNDVGYGVGQRSVEQGYSVGKVARQGYGLTERDDATGLDHTWFRKNENQAGRWTSPDPYNGSMNLGDPQSFNRYSYVGSDPVNFVDPNGLMECSAQYSFEQCGGSSGFWGGGYYGFGNNVAVWNNLFGIFPQSIQNDIRGDIEAFIRWLGDADYIGEYTWGIGNRSLTFSALHGWDGLFDSMTGRFNLPSQSNLNDNARALIQDLGGLRGPALLDLMLYLELAAAAVIGAPILTDAAIAALSARIASKIASDLTARTIARELAHPQIFRVGNTHALTPLIARLGSQAAVISQVAQAVAGKLPANGDYTIVITLGGRLVVVTGTVSNQVPYISNIWIP
jgi:RHS repeat-associated protein